MYIKIFFGNKPLYLTDTIEGELEEFIHHDDAIFIDELDSHTVKSMIHEMQLDKVHAGVFLHSDVEELKKFFFKKFTSVVAAGGLVNNEKNQYLLIFRKGKWDLPKGKIEEGESLEKCALREVQEETGLKNLKIGKEVMVTYHTYHEGTKFLLKQSHWFQMDVTEEQELKPQTEEGITDIKWVAAGELKSYFEGAYPSVRMF